MHITTQCVNGTLEVGDLVLSAREDEYPCMVGVVTRIAILDTLDHETENDTDDVYVNFENDYSSKRLKEIEEVFSDLYQEKSSIRN